jgi:hypothetical protein
MSEREERGYAVGKYCDELHAEDLSGLEIGDYGYKYRMLEGVVMPPYITPERYLLSRTLVMRSEDICFTSFPKSGSTWLSYILLMITRGGELPTDRTLRDSLQWVASSWTYPRSQEELDAMPSPRIFKSHMPYHMAVGGEPLQSPCRYIYIARNPKDVAVSYYFFESHKSWAGGYDGPWEHWLKYFLEGRVQRGDWFDHVLSWWRHRHAQNILFVKYEDLKQQFETEVSRIAEFLGYPLSTDLMTKIKACTAFESMRKNRFSAMRDIEEMDGFFRKGAVGSWREQFTSAQDSEFDRLIRERLGGSGLEFTYS